MYNKDTGFKINLHITVTVTVTPETPVAPFRHAAPIVHKVTGSSVIDSVSYDEDRRALAITFVGSGKTYEYTGVDYPVVRGLMAAFSKGTYFTRHIRDHYTAHLISDVR